MSAPDEPGEELPAVPDPRPVPSDGWAAIRRLTPARVGLGRVGGSLPTSARLAFRADHARARDAVNHVFESADVVSQLADANLRSVAVSSSATSRSEYIRRPDRGRSLAEDSASELGLLGTRPGGLAIVLCDGLSPRVIQRHGAELAAAIAARDELSDWSIDPVSVVRNGRVAIGDDIGAALRAKVVVVLIGERPGLSVPESIGIYVTLDPVRGRTDAERNCISNVHRQGLSVEAAAHRTADLIVRARRAGATGVELKGDAPRLGAASSVELASQPDGAQKLR